jgi:hypothetical protein
MRSRSPEEIRDAVALIDDIVASLRRESDPDDAVGQLIAALEDQQAKLLASLLDSRAPELTRTTEEFERPQAHERRQLRDRRSGLERRKSRKASGVLRPKGTERRTGANRRQRARRASLDAG